MSTSSSSSSELCYAKLPGYFDGPIRRTQLRVLFSTEVWSSGTKDKDVLLGRCTAPGFEQGQRNVTMVKSKLSVQSEVVDANIAKDIVYWMKGGKLAVDMEVSTSVKVIIGEWNVLEVPVHLLCKGIEVDAANGGSNPRCRLELFLMLLYQFHLFKG